MVPRGHVFGFLGANGAGKTTTMRICPGDPRADGGAIRWDGTRPRDAAAPHLGLPARGARPLSADDRPRPARLLRGLYGVPGESRRARRARWLARFRIPDFADRRAEELSKGNQQKVQFLAAVLHDPTSC